MEGEYKPYSINVYPPIDIINKAFMDVMFFLNWTKVAIIYEEDQGTYCMIPHWTTSAFFLDVPAYDDVT